MKKLTAKQARFVDEYLVDLNATQAAIRAGYSKKTARAIGHENLTKLDIAKAIQEKVGKLSIKTQMTAEMVIEELRKLGFVDVKKLYDENGDLLPIHELPDEIAACVSSVEVVKRQARGGEVEYVHKVRLWDKKGALELLGKHFAQFTDRVQHTGQIEFNRIERRIVDPNPNKQS